MKVVHRPGGNELKLRKFRYQKVTFIYHTFLS